jgi:hypothetical protein
MVFEDLHRVADGYPELKQALLVNAKRDPVVRSLQPLFSWLFCQLVREKEWRMKAEERVAVYRKKLEEAEDKLEEYRKPKQDL